MFLQINYVKQKKIIFIVKWKKTFTPSMLNPLNFHSFQINNRRLGLKMEKSHDTFLVFSCWLFRLPLSCLVTLLMLSSRLDLQAIIKQTIVRLKGRQQLFKNSTTTANYTVWWCPLPLVGILRLTKFSYKWAKKLTKLHILNF